MKNAKFSTLRTLRIKIFGGDDDTSNAQPTLELPERPERVCTFGEASRRDRISKYTGVGSSRYEALEDLSRQCKRNEVPEPQLVPGTTTEYHCGDFKIPKGFFGSSELVYNLVFWEEPITPDQPVKALLYY